MTSDRDRTFDVVLCEPPLQLGERPTRMFWHERTNADEGASFLRQLVREAAGSGGLG